MGELKGRSRGDRIGLLADLSATWRDGRIKFYLTFEALNFRRKNQALFRQGEYVALEAHGNSADCLCAFARVHGGRGAMVVVPRLSLQLGAADGPMWRDNAWSETRVLLPWPAAACRNVLTGECYRPIDAGNRGTALLAGDLLRRFPVALVELS
jgi:(1->4)-alpha-D-glucan 1-alpha-D-glucosylmutase